MKISRLGIFVLILVSVLLGGSCSFYNRVMARKNLVSGAKAYNERKFAEAEERFRIAIEYDRDGKSFESRTARLFLARTLHSGFAGNRKDKPRAEKAITEYRKAYSAFVEDFKTKREALAADPQDKKAREELKSAVDTLGSIVRSVASLHVNLEQDDKWNEWQLQLAEDADLPNTVRARALTELAAKQYSCANDITDSKEVRKTVKKGDESTFVFSKPEGSEDFDKKFEELKKCVNVGSEFIDRAIKLNPESASAWSFRTNLLAQRSRIAEMEGDNEKKDEYAKASEEAGKKRKELSDREKKREEEEARRKSKEAKKKLSAGGKSDKDKE